MLKSDGLTVGGCNIGVALPSPSWSPDLAAQGNLFWKQAAFIPLTLYLSVAIFKYLSSSYHFRILALRFASTLLLFVTS